MFTIDEAFEVLLDAVRHALLDAQDAGADAFRSSNFAGAQTALDRARELQALDAKITALETEVDRWLPPQEAGEQLRLEVDASAQPIAHRRSRRGLKTTEAAFMHPILEVIVELGGSGDVNMVLDRVYTRMEPQLNEHDRSALPSDGVTPRWRNTAQWARNALREQGLLRTDTPRGVWAINDAGRAWLG